MNQEVLPVAHFQFDLSHNDVALHITGEIDALTAPHIKDAVDGLMQVKSDSLTIDLSGVTFIDAAGIGSLVYARRKVRASKLKIVTNHHVRRLVKICNLSNSFAHYDPSIAGNAKSD